MRRIVLEKVAYCEREPSSIEITVLRKSRTSEPLSYSEKVVLANYFARNKIATLMDDFPNEHYLRHSKITYIKLFGYPELRIECDVDNRLRINVTPLKEQLERIPEEFIIQELSKVLERTPKETPLGVVWEP